MAKIVGHVRKIKTAVGMANVIAHNLRREVYSLTGEVLENEQTKGAWFDPTAQEFNQLDPLENPFARRDQLIKEAKEANLKAGLKWRGPQKNSAAAVEIVLSFSPDWAKDWRNNPDDKARTDEFMKRARAFVAEKYQGTIVHMAEHFDEKTPHFHAVLVPLTKNQRISSERDKAEKEVLKQDSWRYSSGDFFGGRVGLRQFQTEIFEAVKDLGLERGVVKSRASHQNLSDYDKELKKIEEKKQALDIREKELLKKEKQVEYKSDFNQKANKVVMDNQEKLMVEKKAFNEAKKDYEKTRKADLAGWEMPPAKGMESAKKYRERVGEEVLGVIANVNGRVWVATDQSREKAQKAESDLWYARKEIERLKPYSESYKELKVAVLGIQDWEDLRRIQTALTPSRSRDINRGMSR